MLLWNKNSLRIEFESRHKSRHSVAFLVDKSQIFAVRLLFAESPILNSEYEYLKILDVREAKQNEASLNPSEI